MNGKDFYIGIATTDYDFKIEDIWKSKYAWTL